MKTTKEIHNAINNITWYVSQIKEKIKTEETNESNYDSIVNILACTTIIDSCCQCINDNLEIGVKK